MMKKQRIFGMLRTALLTSLFPAFMYAQSTQGTDFWVTLMRGDGGKYDSLSLTFSAKQATKVYIENPFTAYHDTVEVGDNAIYRLPLNNQEESCYVTDKDEETPSNHALHITAEKPVSLIAANYKDKSFDVAAILPTPSLMSEYRIQCYTPSAHVEGSKDSKHRKPQGSHFAIVAADDDVVVDITPSVATHGGKPAGVTFATETLKKGQVYYVWSGADDCPGEGGSCEGEGEDYDFTGTVVKARGGKKIAVFNGNSHTNIPYRMRDRDHIYSQAMPINYWGKRFAITSSLTTIDGLSDYWERIDKIRVQALVDGTVVKIDGDSVYTFYFTTNPKHYYEFDFGAKDSKTVYEGDGHRYFEGTSHYIETSCPSAVHLFMTSNTYDHQKQKDVNEKYCNGDPALIWINPIEQRIDTLTFGTFQTNQVKTHFINIVTQKDNVNSVRLDGEDISGQFSEVNGNPDYVFARITGVEDHAHTLTADSGFIAHVYGFGSKESYGYPAGGRTQDLTAAILINGQEFKPGNENLICGAEKVEFSCDLNYPFDSIYWFFGDGQDSLVTEAVSIEHKYEKSGQYNAYVRIFRPVSEENDCYALSDNVYDIIDFNVNIGNSKIEWKRTEIPRCIMKGDESDIKVYLNNPDGIALNGDSVTLTFSQATKDAGFDESKMQIIGDSVLLIHVPSTATEKVDYSIHVRIGSQCPENVFERDIIFQMQYDMQMLTQRYDYILGLSNELFKDMHLENFAWYHNGKEIPDENMAVLQLDRNKPDNTGEFYVCFDIIDTDTVRFCTCPYQFDAEENGKNEIIEPNENAEISATYIVSGNVIFVNADYKGQTNIECYAQWIDVSGQIMNNQKFDLPDGGCTIPTPSNNGLYLLRVVTGSESRSFKFVIQH